ncbi:hypothetical protein NPM09_31890, partial [Bacillus cereus]
KKSPSKYRRGFLKIYVGELFFDNTTLPKQQCSRKIRTNSALSKNNIYNVQYPNIKCQYRSHLIST